MTPDPINPLIPLHNGDTQALLQADSVLKPPTEPTDVSVDDKNPAVDMIRQKLAALFDEEPTAAEEIAEITKVQQVTAAHEQRSRHQQVMYELSNSGKSLAEIQTAWHQYYANLPDDQKREVWQEFYTNSAKAKQAQPAVQPHNPLFPQAQSVATSSTTPLPAASSPLAYSTNETTPQSQLNAYVTADSRSPNTIRDQVRGKINSRNGLKVKHHLQSLLFGLGFGGLVLVIVLFSFFNEVVIAPFIQPSRKVSATPIILSADGVTATNKNEVIIPKINLEIPLDFSAKTINESDIESGLENGVVHYPTTALPGQKGNASFFGHSSNNIFNPGKYKFAFVLLHELIPGDTFTITYNGVAYTYQVFDKKVVEPSDVSVLNPVDGKASTAVLITCDPPGTSLHRLVVWGEQVSPNPSANADPAPTPTTSGAEQSLPGNGPTLWRRLINAITGH